jgi:hypothetical protein
MSTPLPKDRLRVTSDERGNVLRVFVGELDITHLCTRVQSVTERGHTRHEVVLFGWDAARHGAVLRTTGATTQ